jgi:hypothetical protein
MAQQYPLKRVQKTLNLTHQLVSKRAGDVDSSRICLAGSGEARILPVTRTTGIWEIAQEHYTGTNFVLKERIRIIRQANPGWRTWRDQQVPAGTALVLPPADRDFVKIPGARVVVVDQGDGLSRIIQRHYQKERHLNLSTGQIARLIPTVAILNAIADVDNELEPGWQIYIPDEAVDNACGTLLCRSDKHDTNKPNDLGKFEVKIDIDSQLYLQTQNVVVGVAVAERVGDLAKIADLFENKIIRLLPVKDVMGRITHMKILGTNRDLIEALGIKGNYYRVGSEAYVEAMESYAAETGTLVTRGATLGTGLTAMSGALRSAGESSVWGAGLAISIDAGVMVYNGQSDQIMTKKFGLRAANDATSAVVSAGAGTLASALMVAGMSMTGCSVVPGIGTAVGFVVGLAVGAALAYGGVTWWK